MVERVFLFAYMSLLYVGKARKLLYLANSISHKERERQMERISFGDEIRLLNINNDHKQVRNSMIYYTISIFINLNVRLHIMMDL